MTVSTRKPRRTQGRLRKLTRAERNARMQRRERCNPAREAMKIAASAAERGMPLTPEHRRRRPLGAGWFRRARDARWFR